MDDILDRALNTAQLEGASYADARVVESRSQLIEVKNRRVSALQESAGLGLGVRVLVDGAWGFAAVADVSTAEAEAAARLACRVARAGARHRRAPVALAPVAAAVARYETALARDPFEVPLADKIALLIECTGLMGAEKPVRVAQGNLQFWEERKRFASTEGARL
ncbi:MAG: TldD/PmbA family protein, partial [Candidatus Eisenbacteria bacterium]|nr:TldD/PmbA family protein [Candidatus Eisenbacteria bacterium]